MPRLNLFLTGATGYVGGSVLDHIIKWNASNNWPLHITALARKQADVATISSAYEHDREYFNVVQGSYQDSEILSELVRHADVVIHTGESADDKPSATVIAENLKPGALLIHTSGTGILVDRAESDQQITRRYDDVDDIKTITSWPYERHHRDIDDLILNIHNHKPDVNTIIITPPLIYGIGSGKINYVSKQIPLHIKLNSILHKSAIFGTGDAIWSNVHISDLADFYVLLVQIYLSSPEKLWYNDQGYYFVENGQHSWKSITKALDQPLVKYGVIPADKTANVDTADEVHFTTEELKTSLSPENYARATSVFSSNSGSVATRARKLGWVPTKPDVYSTLDEEVKVYTELQKQN
ncbi:hypothetical protein V1514DRAFT_335328 [Lipomyces japonicus]|uniref:uncharacterized protein n=1 Tax=Lipomyces japonicus TaxID=56871 RepID=UPI0034CDA9A6